MAGYQKSKMFIKLVAHSETQKLQMLVLEHAAVHCRCVTRETSQCILNVKTEIFTHVVEM